MTDVPEVVVTVVDPDDIIVRVEQTEQGSVTVAVVEPPVGSGETTTV